MTPFVDEKNQKRLNLFEESEIIENMASPLNETVRLNVGNI
jgi:hypothetical protein